jgi:hypothetical protein
MERPEHIPPDISKTEAAIYQLMKLLIEACPNGLLRIEKILQKVRIERCVEKHFDA